MAFDTLAHSAGASLRQAAAAVDTEAALRHSIGGGRNHRRVVVSVVGACAAAVLLIAWLLIPDGVLRSEPAPPVGPPGGTVGEGLTIPATFDVPAGWRVAHDGGFVVLTLDQPAPGARIYIGAPTRFYPDNGLGTPTNLAAWVDDLPRVEVYGGGTREVAGVTATHVRIRPEPGQRAYFHSPVTLASQTDQTSSEQVQLATDVRMHDWFVVPTARGQLVIAVTAAGPAELGAMQGVGQVLDTLSIHTGTPTPTEDS